MPKGFNNWIENNQQRIAMAKSMPYFIRDNFVGGDVNAGLNWQPNTVVNAQSLKEELALRNIVPTEASKDVVRFVENAIYIGNNNIPVTSKKGYPKTYNPYESLTSAINKMQKGMTLGFDEEYAIEGVYHELRHASAVGWGVYDKSKTVYIETLNQFCARKSYQTIMSVSPTHSQGIMNRGYGYNRQVQYLREFLKTHKLSEETFYRHFDKVTQTKPYETMKDEIQDFFVIQGLSKSDIKLFFKRFSEGG